MAQAGLPGDSIGIISPYRAQLQIIGAMLKQSHKSVECSTIDKYQGRDKECIIISLVRSNSNQNV